MNNSVFVEFAWVMKVLESCENDLQIETTSKLFDFYLKKWKLHMNTNQFTFFSSNFEKEKKIKLTLIKRKKRFSIFGQS